MSIQIIDFQISLERSNLKHERDALQHMQKHKHHKYTKAEILQQKKLVGAYEQIVICLKEARKRYKYFWVQPGVFK